MGGGWCVEFKTEFSYTFIYQICPADINLTNFPTLISII